MTKKRDVRNYYIPLAAQSALLAVFGIAYGTIITHLHDNKTIAPVQVEGINRHSRLYVIFWALAGIALGNMLPWIDEKWSSAEEEPERPSSSSNNRRFSDSDENPVDWTPMVRSVGAFVGIAFAIRRLPWQSTLQESLTLALANPVLWYMIDRSTPGFALSSGVGVAGTLVLLAVKSDIVPVPTKFASDRLDFDSTQQPGISESFVSTEQIGMWTWIASVLFCSCLCFGNIGRRLALDRR